MKRAVGALVCLLVPSAVLAVSTKSFVIETSDAFEKGKLEGTASYASGRLAGALTTDRIPVAGAPVAMASVLGKDDAVYVGTGNEGAIYRVTGTESKLFAKSAAAAITSLVFAGDTLYAGSLPGGRVFAIDLTGKLKELEKLPGADAVWALAYDAKRSLLYAATGPEGKLFAIDAAGKAKVAYDDPAEHLLSLAFDSEGRVLVGTSNGARLVRVTATDAKVVHDFPGQELNALSVKGGLVAAAVGEFSDPTPIGADPSKDTSARLKRPKPGKGKVYALTEAGRVDELYASENGHIASVEVEASGRAVLAGLSQDGRIIRVTLDGERALWNDADERQVVSLALGARVPYFVTSDGVAVYRAKPNTDGGLWTSAVLDAGFPARWGELTWRARGAVGLQTRSGNSETPDATWSEWSIETTKTGPIHSTPSRFLQIRAKLPKDAEVYGLTAYYLPENQPARVKNVRSKATKASEIKPPIIPGSKPADLAAAPTLPLTWDVDNPDGDRLRYRVFYRRDEQNAWLPALREHEILDQNDYIWDTRSIPDGHYRVRVVASDELTNPKPYARSMEAISAPLLVDNHAPEVSELSVSGRTLKGRIVDNVGPVSSIELSIDGDTYAPLYPDDDLLDTREERFSVELENLAPGTHVASIRTTDSGQNIGTRAIELTIGR